MPSDAARPANVLAVVAILLVQVRACAWVGVNDSTPTGIRYTGKSSSSNLGGSGAPTPNYPKNHVKKILPVYRGTNFT
eukprot:SAG11_NODE_16069_length_557_cov_2.465066_1_plen_78_part_00